MNSIQLIAFIIVFVYCMKGLEYLWDKIFPIDPKNPYNK
jgi:hypothetical protein